MKVALVQETVDVRRGGAEASTLEMARHLAGLGLDVSIVYSPAQSGPVATGEVHLLPVPVRGFTRALRTYRFVQATQRLCRRPDFDIIHAVTPCLSANVYQPRGGTYAETVARSLALVSSPTVRWLKRQGRRFNLRQRFLFRLEATLLRKRRHRVFVAAVSDYVRRQVVSGYGFPAERVHVVFNGVDIAPLTAEEVARQRAAQRKKLGVNTEARLVLFVAHNFKLKGLAELIRACALSAAQQQPAWQLAVAGRDRPQRYRRLAHQFGIAERVHFVGTDTPIRDWYAAADVLAHPTWYDPCSRVVLEALSLGLPVVTTRFNGAAEVMETGRHGEAIDSPADIGALAAAIERTLQPDLRAACQADAARMHTNLSMARHARELADLYQRVAESAR